MDEKEVDIADIERLEGALKCGTDLLGW